MIGNLKKLQMSASNREFLLSQDFANEKRRGLRVIRYEVLEQ